MTAEPYELGEPFELGLTGTSKGATAAQLHFMHHALSAWLITILHHGDCVGADQQAHYLFRLARPIGRVTIHPPVKKDKRAFCDGDVILPAKPYLARNRDIAAACQLLLAVPYEMEEIVRSGTWATARYAYKLRKPVIVAYPDGSAGAFTPKILTKPG